jgi:hypothetical protein
MKDYDEQAACQALEDEIGIDASFRLMRIYQAAHDAASGNRYTLEHRPTAIERFHSMAATAGYSKKAVNVYLNIHQ